MTRNALPHLLCLLALASPIPAMAAPPVREEAVATGDTIGMDWSRVPEYRIVPGDQLALNFGPQEGSTGDLYKQLRVRPDGRISVFPIGDVVAAGRTPRDLEAVLVQLLAAEFKNPRVTVEVQEVAGNRVHVLGRVKSPGSFPAGPFMTTLQALAAAGGFEDDAARNSVMVFHRDGARTVRVVRLRLDEDLKSGRLALDVPLSRFDIVYVPRSTIGNINVFAHQFLTEQGGAISTALVGWELFNLDRVFVVQPSR